MILTAFSVKVQNDLWHYNFELKQESNNLDWIQKIAKQIDLYILSSTNILILNSRALALFSLTEVIYMTLPTEVLINFNTNSFNTCCCINDFTN